MLKSMTILFNFLVSQFIKSMTSFGMVCKVTGNAFEWCYGILAKTFQG